MSMTTFRERINELIKIEAAPCLSFFVPVQRSGPDTRQGSVLLRQLVRGVQDRLTEDGRRQSEIDHLLEPVSALVDDALFWEHQKEGLALFRAKDEWQVLQLPLAVQTEVAIQNRMLIRPLLPLLAEDGVYDLLALGRSETRLFRCQRDAVEELEVEGLPESLREINEQYESEKDMQRYGGSGAGTVYHGGSAEIREQDKLRLQEYFRKIDDALSPVLTDRHIPLVLACVDYLDPIFRQVTTLRQLLPDHLSGSPDLSRPRKLAETAWPMVRGHFTQPREKAWESCRNLFGSARVLSDIRLIMAAVSHGRVDTLFLREGRQLTGQYDESSGVLKRSGDEARHPSDTDLLDLAAHKTLKNGGQVFIMNEETMVEPGDCLALLRY